MTTLWRGVPVALLLALSAEVAAKPTPGRLSFVSERQGHRDVYVISADGQNETRLTDGPEEDSNGPSTPDGGRILITTGSGAAPDARSVRFWLRSLAAAAPVGTRSPLATPGSSDLLASPRAVLLAPGFTADGTRLIFESEPDPGQPGLREIYSLSLGQARTGRPSLRQLTRNPEGNFAPTICGPSGYIAFTSSRDRGSELYRMRSDGSDVRRLTYSGGSKWQPRCSPEGLRIYFVSDREGADRIYSVHRNGSEPRRLTARSLDPAQIEDSPAIAPDGRMLAYVLRGAGLGARLHVLDLVTGRDCEVPTPAGSRASDPDWSPRGTDGGSRVAFALQPADRDGQPASAERQIAVTDRGCTRIFAVTSARGPNWHPLWIR